jgi:hypothetical protein
VNRKTFVTTLGAMGLGLGAVVAPLGAAPAANAQEAETQPEEGPAGPFEERLAQHAEMYADFTAALAEELGVGNADEVDAAIRLAIMTVIDQREADGLLTYGQAEALKTLVATSDVPFGPVLMAGGAHQDMIVARFGPGGPEHGDGHVFPGRGEERDAVIDRIREERESRVDNGQDDSETDAEDGS